MDVIVGFILTVFGILLGLATLAFLLTVFSIVLNGKTHSTNIRHHEYDYYEMPDGYVRLDERS